VVSAELKIDASEQADSGIYECIASNQYGQDENRIKLEVKGIQNHGLLLEPIQKHIWNSLISA